MHQTRDQVDLYKYVSTERAIVDPEILKRGLIPLVVDPIFRGVEAQFQLLRMFQLLKVCNLIGSRKGGAMGPQPHLILRVFHSIIFFTI